MKPEHGSETRHGKERHQSKRIATFGQKLEDLNRRLTEIEGKTLMAIVITVVVLLLFAIWVTVMSLVVFTHH